MQISNTQNIRDLTKVKIRDFCIDYGKNKASKFRNRELFLQIMLEELEKRLSANKDDQPLHAEVLRELVLITIGKAKGAQIRSRIKWIEEGERNTAFFLNLEKINFKKNIMSRIVNDDDEVITNQSDILNEPATFYTNLYNQKTER